MAIVQLIFRGVRCSLRKGTGKPEGGYGLMEAMECKTCRYGIQEDGIKLCINKDRLWSESPEEVAIYQGCSHWMPKGCGVMELYKWYKGDELPDRECDCVVVWKHFMRKHHDIFEIKKEIGRVFLGNTSDAVNSLGFCNVYGSVMPKDWIIAWMPIEFPKEVS